MLSRSHSTRKSVSSSDYDYSLKCIVLGDSGVGKTSLLQRINQVKHSTKTSPTVEGEFHTKRICVGENKLQLSIWDTAGQETFRSVTRIYYRGAACAILVYDITRRSTFKSLPGWLKDLKNNSDNSKIVCLLVANKCDLLDQRAVTQKEGELFAKNHGMAYMETSIEGSNAGRMFEIVAQDVYHNIKTGCLIPNLQSNGIKIGRMPSESESVKTRQKKGCSC